jgi:hypothetical protein
MQLSMQRLGPLTSQVAGRPAQLSGQLDTHTDGGPAQPVVPPHCAVQLSTQVWLASQRKPPHSQAAVAQAAVPGQKYWLLAHRHTPFTHAAMPQLAQAPPLMPQAAGPCGKQGPEAELQQPAGHDAASHTQEPFTQRTPGEQAAWAPHMHTLFWQPSAPTGSHAPHATPPTPHVDGDLQVAPRQQPFGHEAPSHTHLPPTQCWPTAHCAPPPQRQEPFVHASARMPQSAHAAPPMPQLANAGMVQTLFAQQPLGQPAPLHTH